MMLLRGNFFDFRYYPATYPLRFRSITFSHELDWIQKRLDDVDKEDVVESCASLPTFTVDFSMIYKDSISYFIATHIGWPSEQSFSSITQCRE